MPFGVPDTRQFPWDQALSNNLQQLTNKVTGGINAWAVNPTVGVDGLALGANHIGYTGVNTLDSSIVRWDGTSWGTLLDGNLVVRDTQLNVYVSQNTGNDNNNGLSSGSAWKTISKFYQEVYKYNLMGKQVNLYLGSGTYVLRFPPNTKQGWLRIYGVSSASVVIQSLVINNQNVIIQGVTIAYPEVLDTTIFYWALNVSNASNLFIGPDVVLGSIGTFASAKSRVHIYCRDQSVLYMSALYPITITGSVNQPFVFQDFAYISVTTYTAPAAVTITPNAAPAVNTGVVNTTLPAPGASDTVATVNCIGNVTVDSFLNMNGNCNINGTPGWKMSVTGNIVGSAYTMLKGSSIQGYVSKTAMPSVGILYPPSISSGSVDATSSITGTGF